MSFYSRQRNEKFPHFNYFPFSSKEMKNSSAHKEFFKNLEFFTFSFLSKLSREAEGICINIGAQ